MTIRHLRIFAAVVDCGTMHAAAQKLYLSQPTITQAVKELEEHYGCLLFERYGRRLMITEGSSAASSSFSTRVTSFRS